MGAFTPSSKMTTLSDELLSVRATCAVGDFIVNIALQNPADQSSIASLVLWVMVAVSLTLFSQLAYFQNFPSSADGGNCLS
jgi:hypothetical protein